MRFVIDMNLSPAWVDVLMKMGHHAVHWSTVGQINATDAQIMVWARDIDPRRWRVSLLPLTKHY
ncbi:MAG: DUF5615 family PIN-like protein [Prosthecobacter sp.]|uniref:DUF5615 family PIN-like protein n=1 Tax=Prosthecobacter sp. TaxID=1965333 RepID=UPI003900CE5E